MSTADARILLFGAVPLLVLGLWLRWIPTGLAQVRGVDAWFHLLCAARLDERRRLPVTLDCFLLEQPTQRYPPLFAWLLSYVPQQIRDAWMAWPAILIDLLHVAFLAWMACRLGIPGSGVLVAIALYCATPGLVLDCSTLNPRSLGGLLASGTLVSAMAHAEDRHWMWLLGAIVGGALVLLTSKMTAQFVALGIATLSATSQDWWLLLVLGGSVVLAQVVTGGFYREVAKAHSEILRYYRRNVANLNAHQVLDSPVYQSRNGRHASRRLFRPGWRGTLALIKTLGVQVPWLPLVLAAVDVPKARGELWGWVGVAGGLALVTTFYPPLRLLGEGFRYLKFAVFPAALLVAQAPPGWLHSAVGVVLLAGSVAVSWRLAWTRPFEALDPPFRAMIAFLRESEVERVACLPSHRASAVAYLTGKKVLWGGHSSGYEELEAWAPVLREPMSRFIDRYAIDLLVLDERYVTVEDMPDVRVARLVFEARPYRAYQVRTAGPQRDPNEPTPD